MLIGDKSILRPPMETDLPLLAALRNDLETQFQLMAVPRANSLQKVAEWLSHNLSDEKTIFFVIACKEDDRPAGYIQLKNLNLINGTGELGICLSRETQGKGIAEEAMKILEQYSRDVFNLRKITLQVLQSNRRAISFYENNGYEHIGVFKKHHYQNADFQDVAAMEKFID